MLDKILDIIMTILPFLGGNRKTVSYTHLVTNKVSSFTTSNVCVAEKR